MEPQATTDRGVAQRPPAVATSPEKSARGADDSAGGQQRSPGFSLKGVQGFFRGRNLPGTVRLNRAQPSPEASASSGPVISRASSGPPVTRSVASFSGVAHSSQDSDDPVADLAAALSAAQAADARKARARSLNEDMDNAAVQPGSAASSAIDSSRLTRAASSGPGIPNLDRNLMDSRIEKFQKVLSANRIDLDKLRELTWNGVPPELRPTCWRLLTGYEPPAQERRQDVLRMKREEYRGWVDQYYEVSGCSSDEADELRSEEELAIIRQIRVDCPRTAPGVPFFHRPEIQRSLERILFIRAVRNPASGYVQGFNDLVTPFLGVFMSEVCAGDMDTWDTAVLHSDALYQVEADCYWCLAKLLDGIQDHYTFAQRGIQMKVFKLGELVRRIDEQIHDHLETEGVQFLQFAFRWFNCLLLREVPFPLVARLWDTYIAEGDTFADFLVYACASFFITWADKLRGMEFQDMIIFLQKLPTEGWSNSQVEMVLSRAYMWRAMFERAQSHLGS